MECRNVARVMPATDILVCDSHGGWSHICLYQPHPTMHAWPPSSKQANSKENKAHSRMRVWQVLTRLLRLCPLVKLSICLHASSARRSMTLPS